MTNQITKKAHSRAWSWKAYAASISKPADAVAEIVANATTAALAENSKKAKRIAIELTETHLSVENSGIPFIDIESALNYGYESKEERKNRKNVNGDSNQHGTGIKNAFSFLYPESNGKYRISTKKDKNSMNGYYYTEGGYQEDYDIHEVNEKWPYEKWSSSRVESDIHSSKRIDVNKVKCELEESFTSLLLLNEEEKMNLTITFNDEILHPVIPTENGMPVPVIRNGQGYEDAVISQNIQKWEKEIGGKIDVWEFTFNKSEGQKYGFYTNSFSQQGVYLSVGNKKICYLGTKILWRNKEKNQVINPHPEMNHMVTFINIRMNKDIFEIPLNTFKTNVEWDTAEGEKLRDLINDCCGQRFKKKAIALKEANDVKLVMQFLERTRGANSVNGVIRECYIDDEKSMRADMLLYSLNTDRASVEDKPQIKQNQILTKQLMAENNIRTITDVIEIKAKNKLLTASIAQVASYAVRMQGAGFPMPHCIVVSSGEKGKGVDALIESYKQMKVYIDVISINQIKKVLDIDYD